MKLASPTVEHKHYFPSPLYLLDLGNIDELYLLIRMGHASQFLHQ